MSELTATIRPNGTIEVDIELPPGAPCDAADEVLRAVLSLLGARMEETADVPRRPAVPNGIPTTVKIGGGG